MVRAKVPAKVLPTAIFNIYFSLPLTALTQLTGLGWAVARWKLWHGLKSVSAPGGGVWRVELCNFDYLQFLEEALLC